MGVKTEDFVSNLPPKEMTENIDWLGIFDSFDPSTLDQKFINECARRNPYDTCYRWDTPSMPIEERLGHSQSGVNFKQLELYSCVKRIETEGLTATIYKNARSALIAAIGAKGAHEYNKREYDRLGEDGRLRLAEEYKRWEQEREKRFISEEAEFERRLEEDEDFYWADEFYTASMHEKIVKIRKGVLGSNGKSLTQREFAKFIGYPINKYTEAEKIDRYCRSNEPESEVEYELLEKLVMICHANPYWLFDEEADADYAEYDRNEIVMQGDAPCVFATPDVILRWIEAGKPQSTSWEEVIL